VPARRKESMVNEVDCSLKPFAYLENSDQNSYYWRTSQGSLFETWESYSESWPRSGMTRNGTAYRLSPLVRLTDVIGCSSLPTPNTMDHAGKGRMFTNANAKKWGGVNSLGGMAETGKWPNEQMTDGTVSDADSLFSVDADAITENGNATNAENGHTHSTMTVPMDVRIVDMKLWPTPSANEDAAGQPGANMQPMLGNHPDVRNTGTGTLNPEFVEWLMGFPIGFTDLDVSETQLSPK